MHFKENIFDELPPNASDDEIIERILTSLCEEEMELFIFEDNPISIDEKSKKRIINSMIKEGIAKKGTTVMGGAHTLIYTQQGKNIYYDGGWLNAIEKRKQLQNYQIEIEKLSEENLRLNNENLKLRHTLIETEPIHIEILKHLKSHTDYILVEEIFSKHSVRDENKRDILNEMKRHNLIDYINPTPPPTMFPSPGNIPLGANGVLGFMAKISLDGHRLLKSYNIQKDANKQFNLYGNMTIGNNANLVLFSDSSSINNKSNDETLALLNEIINQLKQQPSDNKQSKERLGFYENLHTGIVGALNNNSPFTENLFSVARQILSLIG